jgi:hypothetical protein
MVIDAFYSGGKSFNVLFFCLLFLKVGELFNELIKVERIKLFAVLGVGSLFMILYMSDIFIVTGSFIFGFCLMKVRDKTINYSSKNMKFTARAVGFILSPVLPNVLLFILCIVAAFIIIFSALNENVNDNFSIQWYEGDVGVACNLCMGMHHFHYFSYAYSIPLAYYIFTSLSSAWIGLVFYIGWAAYNAYERLIKPSWNYLLLGHVIAAISLSMLANNNNLITMTFWWFMTGLGGGTVYMIHHLSVPKRNSVTELKISEGFGHVFGILVWGVVIYFFGIKATFLTGAMGGIFVAMISLYEIFKLKLKDSRGGTK